MIPALIPTPKRSSALVALLALILSAFWLVAETMDGDDIERASPTSMGLLGSINTLIGVDE
jgi:hypothetical protein